MAGTDHMVGTPRTREGIPDLLLWWLAFVSVLAVTCLNHGWWPSPFGQLSWIDPLLSRTTSITVLAGVSGVWIHRAWKMISHRHWTWRIPVIPVILIGGAVYGFMFPAPTFLDVRSDFELVAQQLLQSPGSIQSSIEIGAFDVRFARSGPDGEVYFVSEDSRLAVTKGWVYSPNAEPSGPGEYTIRHLSGPWYEFKSTWRS